MGSSIFSIAFALFLLMDPLGNVPLFIAILKDFSQKKQKKIILRELVLALATIIGFYFIGDVLLDFIHIKQHTLLMAGGLILFLIAIRMIFPASSAQKEEVIKNLKAPVLVPLAIPLVAGPAVLATVMLYSQQKIHPIVVLSAILLAWVASTLILLSSTFLKKCLGPTGLSASEKLMGLLLTLLSIQMFLEGLSLYIAEISTTSVLIQ